MVGIHPQGGEKEVVYERYITSAFEAAVSDNPVVLLTGAADREKHARLTACERGKRRGGAVPDARRPERALLADDGALRSICRVMGSNGT